MNLDKLNWKIILLIKLYWNFFTFGVGGYALQHSINNRRKVLGIKVPVLGIYYTELSWPEPTIRIEFHLLQQAESFLDKVRIIIIIAKANFVNFNFNFYILIKCRSYKQVLKNVIWNFQKVSRKINRTLNIFTLLLIYCTWKWKKLPIWERKTFYPLRKTMMPTPVL